MIWNPLTNHIFAELCHRGCLNRSIMKYGIYSLLPTAFDRINVHLCAPHYRKGLLCSECVNGFSIPMNTSDPDCANCSHLSPIITVPLYVLLQLLSMTIFFFIIATFRKNITYGPLLGYILKVNNYKSKL